MKNIPGVVFAGLIVGTLDITAACLSAYLLSGVGPARVFRFVASGVFGADAAQGGAGIAALGLLFHYLIALGWTVIYFFLYPKVPLFQKVPVGIAYGLFIWVFMNFVVIPLSRVPARPFNWSAQSVQIGIHMFLIGLSIALLAKRHYSAGA